MWHGHSLCSGNIGKFDSVAALRKKILKKNDFPVGRPVESAEFAWHSFLFIRLYFSPLVYQMCIHELMGGSCLWHSTGGLIICGGKLWSVWESIKTGVYDVNVAIQTPPALRIALQPHFFVFYFPSFTTINPFCTWKKERKRRTFKYLFLNPSKNTSNREKEVNLFWFCLILLLIFDAYSSFLILRIVYFMGYCIFCSFSRGGSGRFGKGKEM